MTKPSKVTITILMNDIPAGRGFFGENGFSALIELVYDQNKERKVLLFDTGPSSIGLKNNLKIINRIRKEQLEQKIETIILSHGHWDHTGGLKEVIKNIPGKVSVICHRNALLPKFFDDGKGKTYNVGIQEFISKGELEKLTKLVITSDPHTICDGVITTGEILKNNQFETMTGDLTSVYMLDNGNKIPDTLEDDLSLIIQLQNDSYVLLTGCCHSGIINTLGKTKDIIGSSKVLGIIGGFHLHDASKERLQFTNEQLKGFTHLKVLAPCHCTGLKGMCSLYNAFEDKYVQVGAGSQLIFPPEPRS